ncbi:hypothetical protein SS50377_22403 [Spironucleus salmonicida]|uniref:Uncharacterized protein n=1 Tax=Spironucleus salmonicida TaxID=348837 RepID=V6LCX3_9EUKA|nr:hypothetical protein SS50377_22403 [Spironucleus salmonicida]|eukprot:EST42103.1 Hypothetical protein SS50377_18412 [Spironucleus salmonicida]
MQSPLLKKQCLRQARPVLFINNSQHNKTKYKLYNEVNQEKNIDLSIKRQQINNEAVIEMDQMPSRIYLHELQYVWTQLDMSQQERSYATYQLAVDSQQISTYLKLANQVIQTRLTGKQSLEKIRQLDFSSNIHDAFSELQTLILILLESLNTFRSIIEQPLNFDFEIQNIFTSLIQQMPTTEQLLQFMTSFGYTQDAAEKQLQNYFLQTQPTYKIEQSIFILFLCPENFKATNFPSNFSKWAHRMASTNQHDFAGQKAFIMYQNERQHIQQFKQINDKIQSENFRFATVPTKKSSTVYDLYNVQQKYVSDIIAEKINENVQNSAKQSRAISRMNSSFKITQKEVNFSQQIMKRNANQAILNYKRISSSCVVLEEFSQFYIALRIDNVEQRYINQICSKSENLRIMFIKNARQLIKIQDEYKINFVQLKNYIQNSIIDNQLIDLINRQIQLVYQARIICNRPISLPELIIGTDFIFLYFNKQKHLFSSEHINMLNQKYLSQLQHENEVIYKFIADQEFFIEKEYRIFTLKFELNEYDIYRLE